MKRKEILPFTTQMHLEDITPGEISQPQKDRDCAVPLKGTMEDSRILEAESTRVVAKDCREGEVGGDVQWV